ncbi:hypothetical protein EUB48_07925 [Rhodoferax sediminis]|uniref:Uncharacterized protein n=1 Tax=Rhodoferax sediminis TaxID=2509614 RepID=A0A515D9Y4_9BURK|nr:hypothetical protein EUB48_07925 [Rhodoferax sediminis]
MAARKWTSEQRQRQAERIRQWAPWTRSTGPQSVVGKRKASRNASKGGFRPRLRALAKGLSELLRSQRELLR